MTSELNIQDFLPFSFANGPGARCVLWLQGCSLACSGCFNPETHSFVAGKKIAVNEIFKWIIQCSDIEGITISGGEPLQQAERLIELLDLVRARTALSILLLTGFSFEEVEKLPNFESISKVVDVMLCGRYDQNLPTNGFGSNKTFHFFGNRYDKNDMDAVPESEIIIESGQIIASGVAPLNLR